MTSSPGAEREPVAIIGIGCRLPGGANDPAGLWQRLCDGFDAIGRVPADRFDIDALFDARAATPGRVMSQWGGFLDGIDGFDASFFETAPREAERLDPQQRLLLETSWEALEDAGIAPTSIAGTNAGVFVGMWINELEARLFADPDHIDFHMTTGTGRYAASGRISYFFDLLGPSITIDTACSSSLVAVHLACQSLASGECDVALAGGANVILEPSITIAYSQSRMMAPDGHCKFGDAAADGYVRSDGVVVVALKRLVAAQADGDRIYAVILGSAVTNDGRSSGFLATPGQVGQEEMLRVAYGRAGVDPRSVQYVEAHGTGTAAGDPVELGALGAVVGAGRDPAAPCLVGSIKSNVGHTEGAAGAAGLVKVALALHHGEIPASLHVAQPNPGIAWQQLGVRVASQRQPWPAVDGPRRAGVSAFGIAGTNAHVVLEAAPESDVAPGAVLSARSAHVLALSASGVPALRAMVGQVGELLTTGHQSVADVCAATAGVRGHLADRVAVVGTHAAELVEQLRRAAERLGEDAETARASPSGPPRIVFVFPGQGSQWTGMATQLLAEEPAFAAAMQRCDEAIRTEAGWSPIAFLTGVDAFAATPFDGASRADDIDVVQPLLFAIQVALSALWASWGITPDAVVGHSMGEVAAAHVAGALSLADATAVICRRSALLRRISGRGAMALVEMPLDATTSAIANHAAQLSIAASNSGRATVISGEPAALDEVLARLQAADVFCRPVKVDVASHSPQVDPLLDELRGALTQLSPRPSAVAFHSTVEAEIVAGDRLDAEYWVRNLRRPVLFAPAVEQLLLAGHEAVVEISPHPILLPAVEQIVRDTGVEAVLTGSMRRGEPERATMLVALAALYERGAEPVWPAVIGTPSRHVTLPAYPWQRERFWYTPATPRAASDHPVLGQLFRPADQPGTMLWETAVDASATGLFHGHVVRGTTVVPAAGFLELARCAATAAWPGASIELTSFELREMLAVEDGCRMQIAFDELSDGRATVRIHALVRGSDNRTANDWRLHAEGRVLRREMPSAAALDIDAARTRCVVEFGDDAHSSAMRARGLDYAPAFLPLTSGWRGPDEALARLVAGDGTSDAARNIRLLDGAMQLALAALDGASPLATFVPASIGTTWLGDPVGDEAAWGYARVTRVAPRHDAMWCDVTLAASDGRVVATASDLRFVRVGADNAGDDITFALQWQPADAVVTGDGPSRWIVFTDGGLGDEIARGLAGDGSSCVIVRSGEHLRRESATLFEIDPHSPADCRTVLAEVLAAADGSVCIVDARCTALVAGAELSEATRVAAEAATVLVQALAGVEHGGGVRLSFVTVDAQRERDSDRGGAMTVGEVEIAQGMLWGIGRVVAAELPSLRCTLVDVGAGDAAAAVEELRAAATGSTDQQVRRRAGHRAVARLQRLHGSVTGRRVHVMETDEARLVATTPGSLDGLRLLHQPRQAPRRGEIEVRVSASGLNFIDVLKAMGIYPGADPGAGLALGAECAGVVVSVGEAVSGLAVGDEVVAITPSFQTNGMLSAYVTVPAEFAVARPAELPAAVAAGQPIAYITAHLALHELARMRAGERVLIHSATGGVGLAALHMCRAAGLEVLATAGTEAKRDVLRALGVAHVFDSRSTTFAAEVLGCTNGRGVDIVLNSLAGAAIGAGLSALAPSGRFVEIGKRDVYAGTRIAMHSLKDNQAFFVVDLAGLTEHDPGAVAGMFRTVMAGLASGALPALPVATAPISAAAETFRTMAAAEHVGKLVLLAPDAPVVAQTAAIRSDATYVITGGTGALGLATAARLVYRGARHLALIARNQPDQHATAGIDALRASGATVCIVPADVGDATSLDSALATVRATMPPLRGVVHAAGVLADATLAGLDHDQLHRALAPKVTGGWNLHRATLHDQLDLFVLFSSVAGILGLAGQANYAAANAFLDSLAAARSAAGLAALSVDWGPWAGAGLAAAQANRGERLAERGLGSLQPEEALDALDRLLDSDVSNAVVMRFDASRWLAAEPQSAALLADLLADGEAPVPSTGAAATLVARLAAVPAGPRRRAVIEEAVCGDLAPVLRTVPERIDRRRAFKTMGLDSLMALELRNRLEAHTGLQLSATIVWNHPTVTLLAQHLDGRLGIEPDAQPGAAAVDTPTVPDDASPVGEAHAGEVTRGDLAELLRDELAAVDRLLGADRATP